MKHTFSIGCLSVIIADTRAEMGEASAALCADKLKALLDQKEYVNMMFAAAPSQNECLAALSHDDTLDFSRIHAFHMDEYIGLAKDAPQGFGNFLKERLFGIKPFASVNYINGQAPNMQDECDRYAALLRKYPIDLCLMGIGENGHIAFNDPGVANFQDNALVRVVALEDSCRVQQVNDGCFASVAEVPEYAYTVTVPALFSSKSILCVVPGELKANAVRNTLLDPISEKCPATILRTHLDAVLILDQKAAQYIDEDML